MKKGLWFLFPFVSIRALLYVLLLESYSIGKVWLIPSNTIHRVPDANKGAWLYILDFWNRQCILLKIFSLRKTENFQTVSKIWKIEKLEMLARTLRSACKIFPQGFEVPWALLSQGPCPGIEICLLKIQRYLSKFFSARVRCGPPGSRVRE